MITRLSADLDINAFALLDLVIGLLILGAFAIERALARYPVPPLVGFILLGLGLRWADDRWDVISEQGLLALEVFGGLGLVMLLFRVGLESELHALLDKLPKAVPIWIGNVLVSGVAGYLTVSWGLGLGTVPALLVGTAMTATSAVVAADIWRDCGRLKDPDGALMLDVVELDDVSGIVIMMLVLAIAPALLSGANGSVGEIVASVSAALLIKLAAFGAVCLITARYGERLINRILRTTHARDSFLIIVGTGILIAAVGDLLGFSLAVGAFFAGLIFSRDPTVVKMESAILPLYAVFAPFFFIGIGLAVEPALLTAAPVLAIALVATAVLGKVIGGALPAAAVTDRHSAFLIGISLVPRAEIALVVMDQGMKLGADAVPPALYAGMVVTILVTCFAVPIILRLLLTRAVTAGEG